MMKKKIFTTLMAMGVICGGFGIDAAEARGIEYVAKDDLGRVCCNLYVSEVAGANNIVEIMYTDRDSSNGQRYAVTATGYFTPEGIAIRHGNKDFASGAVDKDFLNTEYPVQDLPDGFIIQSNKANTEANEFFSSDFAKEIIPNHYTRRSDVVPYVSDFGVRMLVESIGYEETKLDSFYYHSPDNPYMYEYSYIPDLQVAYPQANLIGSARRMQVSVISESGMRSTVNTFIVDDKLENVWRVEQDGSLFQIYGLDGVG